MSPGRHQKRTPERAANGPTGLAKVRSRIALRFRRLEMRQRIIAGGGLALVVALTAGVVVAVASSGTPPRHPKHKTDGVHTVSSSTIPPHHHHVTVDTHLCPLTGEEAPGGKVPQRPALGVKIGNDPASRPQSGLLDADIVYEEMAEGGITRYLAIFQCENAPQIGPTRSVRWDDWHVLQSYGHPILAFSGGINQWNQVVAGLGWLFDANGSFYPTANAYYRTADRVPPWNYYTSSSALWALDAKNQTPPPQQFSYSTHLPPDAGAASQVTIDGFASGTSVVWKWDARGHDWLRYYATQPDVDASGTQLHAANVLIQFVATEPGPYAESGTTPDTDSLTAGGGKAYLLRDGHVEAGTWQCSAYGQLTTFRMTNGHLMTFKPGNTWVELVPDGYGMNIVG